MATKCVEYECNVFICKEIEDTANYKKFLSRRSNSTYTNRRQRLKNYKIEQGIIRQGQFFLFELITY